MLVAHVEEERRLTYVGVTRAKKSLAISWCKKRRRGRDHEVREPSRFIAELGLAEAPAPDKDAMSRRIASPD